MKSFRDQYIECKASGNCFVITEMHPFYGLINMVVCVKYKTYCHSKACFEERNNDRSRECDSI